MIRRNEPSPDGTPQHWILISQIEHARLAGQVARHWNDPFAPIEPREELIWAIDHHDDGWRAWEQSPDVEPKTQRPRSFVEMDLDDSLAIWTGSIEAAALAGPLEAYTVAGHFSALARRAASHVGQAQRAAAERFIAHNAQVMQQSLVGWQSQEPAQNTPELAGRALGQLQFFDALSLWFCCAPETEPYTLTPPGGPDLELRPLDFTRIAISPWPLDVTELWLEIPTRTVPATRYQSRSALAAAASQPLTLRWQLQPGA